MKNKIIYVDFDDTIFIWDIHTLSDVNITDWMSYNNIGHLNYSLRDYLREQKQNNMIILLTHCCDSIELKMKQEYLQHICGDLFDDYLGVSAPELKVNVVARSKELYGIDPYQTVLIDDRLKTRVLFAENGYLTENPLNIANKCYMEKVYDRSNKTIKE